MWRFAKKRPIFSEAENQQIVQSIQEAERQTSGEIRIFVESHCRYVDALDRAVEIFNNLEMAKTALRNGVLFYLAVKDKQLAIYADEGIHKAAGNDYWQQSVKEIISVFSKESLVAGITTSIYKIGQALKTHFPYDKDVDKNELPDEIVFGK